jgi:HAD superfamily hydrolase (TIGR01509 family)
MKKEFEDLLKGAKACIFDMDGTLVDSLGIWTDIDKRFFHERGMEVPFGYDTAISSMSFREMAVYTKETYSILESVEEIMDIWLGWSREAYLYTIKAKPGAVEFLEEMKHRGLRLSLATTNKEELYMPCLRRNGLDGFFDIIENVNRLQTKKTEPKIYLTLARDMGVEPRETLVFEDILMAIRTAKKASFRTVSVYDQRNECDMKEIKAFSDYHIRNYLDILCE